MRVEAHIKYGVPFFFFLSEVLVCEIESEGGIALYLSIRSYCRRSDVLLYIHHLRKETEREREYGRPSSVFYININLVLLPPAAAAAIAHILYIRHFQSSRFCYLILGSLFHLAFDICTRTHSFYLSTCC